MKSVCFHKTENKYRNGVSSWCGVYRRRQWCPKSFTVAHIPLRPASRQNGAEIWVWIGKQNSKHHSWTTMTIESLLARLCCCRICRFVIVISGSFISMSKSRNKTNIVDKQPHKTMLFFHILSSLQRPISWECGAVNEARYWNEYASKLINCWMGSVIQFSFSFLLAW